MYGIVVTGDLFSEIKKVYYQAVLDSSWAEKMYLVERNHYLKVAKSMFTESQIEQVDDPMLTKKVD